MVTCSEGTLRDMYNERGNTMDGTTPVRHDPAPRSLAYKDIYIVSGAFQNRGKFDVKPLNCNRQILMKQIKEEIRLKTISIGSYILLQNGYCVNQLTQNYKPAGAERKSP